MKTHKLLRKTHVAILALIVSWFISSTGWATTYYVDFQSGSDTNDGNSQLASFKHCPGDGNATDISASTTLFAGDTVIFKGGIVYNGTIDIDWSGNSVGNEITYDGNSADTWGTGRAIIDGDRGGADYQRGFYATANRDYIIINNFEIRNMDDVYDGNVFAASPAGIDFAKYSGTHDYIEIKNCYIHDIHRSISQGGTYHSYGGAVVSLQDCTYSRLHDSSLSHAEFAVGIRGDNNEVYNNSITITAGGVAGAPNTNLKIYNNDFYDCVDFFYASYHSDIIHLWGDASNNIEIYNNRIFGDMGTNPAMSGYIYIEDNLTNLMIYNNLFWWDESGSPGTDTELLVWLNNRNGDPGGYIRIFNNTFYYGSFQSQADYKNLEFKNNILIGAYPTIYETSGADLDNNCVYAPNYINWDGSVYNSLSAYQAATTHGDNCTEENPQLNIDTINFTAKLTESTPSGASHTRDGGLDLSIYFNTDIIGVSRPYSSGWDMGAYEYGLSSPQKVRLDN